MWSVLTTSLTLPWPGRIEICMEKQWQSHDSCCMGVVHEHHSDPFFHAQRRHPLPPLVTQRSLHTMFLSKLTSKLHAANTSAASCSPENSTDSFSRAELSVQCTACWPIFSRRRRGRQFLAACHAACLVCTGAVLFQTDSP